MLDQCLKTLIRELEYLIYAYCPFIISPLSSPIHAAKWSFGSAKWSFSKPISKTIFYFLKKARKHVCETENIFFCSSK